MYWRVSTDTGEKNSPPWKLQKKVARVGFDWPDIGGVIDKLEEELEELRAILDACQPEGDDS